MTSNYPGEGRSASDSRDGYTYYAELLVAVDGQGPSLPQPRVTVDDLGPDLRAERDRTVRFDDTWT